MFLVRHCEKKLASVVCKQKRLLLSTTSKYLAAGINDKLYGLTEDQQNFRQTVFDFCQKELAPHADKIDKDNGWDDLR